LCVGLCVLAIAARRKWHEAKRTEQEYAAIVATPWLDEDTPDDGTDNPSSH